jgi:hypothetical protein
VTVIRLVSPGASLERRGGTAERPRWQQWFSPDLLSRLRDFYTNVAPGLCPNPPLVIDTDGLSTADVARQVRHLLPAPPANAVLASVQPVTVAPVFAALYAEAGGMEALGHPLTAPFPYRGGHVQLFQLGALHHDGADRARIWDPATATLPETAARR